MCSQNAVSKMIVGEGNESGVAGDKQLARSVTVEGGALQRGGARGRGAEEHLQQILQKSTDFLRRIIVPVAGQEGAVRVPSWASVST